MARSLYFELNFLTQIVGHGIGRVGVGVEGRVRGVSTTEEYGRVG